MPLLYEQKEFKERDESLASLSVQSFEYIYYRTRVRSLAMLVTHSLTDSRLVNLINVTLRCEDANSKLVQVVTVADVSNEDCVCNTLLWIWKLRFGHKS